MRGQTYVILAIIFVFIVAIFAVINVDPVEFNYVFGSGEAPLILVILFSVLMGGVITAAVSLVKMIRLQRERNTLVSENKHMKETLKKHGLLKENGSKKDSSGQLEKNKH
ncbi:hypothetical protein GCM10007063_03010 [Lentibacillus kapialis]|uniref:Lipopolysaccharide assembly protein A domain-containing protein n=1 Tax=Lentibacillus kapialis TaxID=340214 RepID=A0A917UTC8_9BACI|nr:lipopolysaccharide assembly protein LapA domain-containing protein [Lentibacillus kapialis]GGJ83959.1 hypothetical protein GCM10007063_03010 [Lentibacillus kapialis]